MKRKYFSFVVLVSLLVLASDVSYAQRGRGRGGRTRQTNPAGEGTTPAPSTDPSTGRAQDVSNPTPPPAGSVTFVYDTTAQEGMNEYGAKVLPSKRNPYAFVPNEINARTPLAYDHVREEDAVYSVFVTRDIDANEKINLPFIYKAKENTGDQRFFSILLKAVREDSVVAFEDERFTTPYDPNVILGKMSRQSYNEYDTIYSSSDPNNPDKQDMATVTPRQNSSAPKPDSVYRFRINEQWFFDKETSRMSVRIIGIAPLMKLETKKVPGAVRTQQDNFIPLFWIYYPDLRTTLAKTYVYNPKNAGARMSWDDLFESRYFSSFIVKSSLDNPGDQRIRDYVKDPMFQLYEGENIKNRIFDYEQSVWSY